ncbi:MAG: hypothetical protein K6A65_08110 [Succinivibrionaceae bacterium]|nr:hypothetical protein [Succinivibrionaceae bacterium]
MLAIAMLVFFVFLVLNFRDDDPIDSCRHWKCGNPHFIKKGDDPGE